MATSASKRRGGKKAESSHNGDSEEDLEIVSVLASKKGRQKAEQAKKQLDEECQNIQRQLLQAGRDFVTRHTNEVDQITRRHTQRMEELHEERNDLLKKISSESDKLMNTYTLSTETITKNRDAEKSLLQELVLILKDSFSDIVRQMDQEAAKESPSHTDNKTSTRKKNQPADTPTKTPKYPNKSITVNPPPVSNHDGNPTMNARKRRGGAATGTENDGNDLEGEEQDVRERQVQRRRKADF
ncbi:hypothetical protein SeLEV6574_g03524 [Synchytrium endobioticum]|uniref:Uncharacterized protein n=1 Tax=Synchytrium endobioticum TaxID=286115 RepID=A0A507D3Y2_9FUNG|nr:hypothetical protein SeLEV6574_g03524 [Synchytrium endobioticum]